MPTLIKRTNDYEPGPSMVREHKDEHYLYTQQDAIRPANRESNEAQWEQMTEQIKNILRARGIQFDRQNLIKWHYKHGGVVLYVRYTIAAKTVTEVKEYE